MRAAIVSTDGITTIEPAPFAPVLAAALRSGRGRAPRSFADFLESEVYLPNDGGPRSGQRFQFRFQPIAKLWAAEIDSGRWCEHVYTGPSQSGKSLMGYVLPMIWRLSEFGESVGFAVPAEEMASDKWEADIAPVMRASARLRRMMPTRGAGSAGGAIRDRVTFSNGAIAKILTAGGRDAAKAGYTLRTVLITEAAAFSRGSSKSAEADPLEQIRARQRSLPVTERITFIEGTPTVADELPTTLYAASTKTRIVSPCPHCGRWISPTRENLLGWEDARTEVEAAELATWVCPECGEAISNAERLECLADAVLLHDGQTIDKRGRISGDLPRTRRLFFRYAAWHNAFLSAADLAVDLWAAAQTVPETRQRESAERKLAQFVFGTPYEPPELEAGPILEAADIERRRDRWPRGLLAPDAFAVVVGIDVGERRIHWVAGGVRPKSQLQIVDYGAVPVSHENGMKAGLQAAIVETLQAIHGGYAVEDGRRGGRIQPGPESILIDSGHLPEVVAAACTAFNAAAGQRVAVPLLGRGESQMDGRNYNAPTKTGAVVKKIDPDGRWHLSYSKRLKCYQITIDADHFKLETHAGFRTQPGKPGSITLFAAPVGVHQTFTRHQINEQWIDGHHTQTGANHFKDATAYMVCAASRLGFSRVNAEPITDADAAQSHNWEE